MDLFTCTRLPFCVPLPVSSTPNHKLWMPSLPVEDMRTGTVSADKANCLDVGMVTNGVNSWNLAMNNIDNTIG